MRSGNVTIEMLLGRSDCENQKNFHNRTSPFFVQRNHDMPDDIILSDAEILSFLDIQSNWQFEDGWLRRTYNTPGFAHTMLLVNTIGYLAEAADHHPDLKVGYAQVTVKLQTHRVKGITTHDTELAAKIEEVVTWKPEETSALDGFPKKWVH